MHTNRKERIRVGQRYQSSWHDQSPELKDVQNVGRQAEASLAAGLQGELQQLQERAARIKRKLMKSARIGKGLETGVKFITCYEKYMFLAC